MAVKATARSGRSGRHGVYNSNHNTLETTRAKESHIDHERTKDNRCAYWDVDGKVYTVASFDSKAQELKMYEHYYADSLQAKNDRYIKERHSERCRDMKDVLTSNKTAPFETLFQIDKDGSTIAAPAQLWKIASQTVMEMVKESNGHFRPLNFAMHLDETTNHVHFRAMFMAKDKDGNWEPNQTKALAAMGFERPHPDKPVNRYNNALISFSDTLRQRFYDRCEREGIQIDREPQSASQRHKETLEYKIDKMNAEIEQKAAQLAEKDRQIDELRKYIKEQEKIAQKILQSNKQNLAMHNENVQTFNEKSNEYATILQQQETQIEEKNKELQKIDSDIDRGQIKLQQQAAAADALTKSKIKKNGTLFHKNEDFPYKMNVQDYQNVTGQLNAIKQLLNSPVYTAKEREEWKRAEQAALQAKRAAESKESEIEQIIEQRVKQRVDMLNRTEPRQIAQLENKLSRTQADRDHITTAIKMYLQDNGLSLKDFERQYGVRLSEHSYSLNRHER